MKKCFVVMGYGTRFSPSSRKKINLDLVYKEIIRPVIVGCGYECTRGDEVKDCGLIDESMYYGILEADLVVADISTLNPNAIYELGVRHGVKKNRTIIMMESKDRFFFDLNHSRTVRYTYSGWNSIFRPEIERVRAKLEGIIRSIEKQEQVDSPIYYFVNDLQEPRREGRGGASHKESKPIYERIKEAVEFRSQKNYAKAFPLFEALSKEIPSDPFFKQQMALCTYKQDPITIESLDRAYGILEPLEDSIDPETSGLIGSIFKRRYKLTNDLSDLDKAINSYKKAYNLFSDYYTGENYAFCLLLKSVSCPDQEEKSEFVSMAKHLYREILEANKDFPAEEINTDYEKWSLATLAACAKVLRKEESFHYFEGLFLSKADGMMKASYQEQMKELKGLLEII